MHRIIIFINAQLPRINEITRKTTATKINKYVPKNITPLGIIIFSISNYDYMKLNYMIYYMVFCLREETTTSLSIKFTLMNIIILIHNTLKVHNLVLDKYDLKYLLYYVYIEARSSTLCEGYNFIWECNW